MKTKLALLAATFFVVTGSRSLSQTLDWGSEVFSGIADSKGDPLDSVFVIQIGAFADGFEPDANNTASWLGKWRVFDQAAYNPGLGYFTSTVHMLDNGTSDSPYMTPNAPSFEGLSAYLWIRKGDQPVEGSEWLLTRADSWTFPLAGPGCCDDELPLQWSVSDLDAGDVPEWGSQGGVESYGAFTSSGSYPLQTFTFVPESSSAMMAALAGVLTTLHRRRNSRLS